jgi:hypothetical protein
MNAAAAAVVVLNGRQAFDPRATLFAHNEPGTWYDASDLGTMFTDSAGTTPVTAVEQAVGLILDKSRGLTLGPELVVNGSFSSAASWTQGGTLMTIGGGVLTGAATVYNTDYQQQTISLVAGKTYQLTYDAVVTAGSTNIDLAGVQSISAATTTVTKFVSCVFVPVSTAAHTFRINGTNFTGTIDNISVREIAGTHAIQATAASRPVLRNRYNLLTYSEQFDNAAWTKNQVSVTANATTAPDGTTTADKVIATAISGAHNLYVGFTYLAAGYSMSFFAKAAEYFAIRVGSMFSGNSVIFNLSDGTIGTASAGYTGTITTLANGWYRCAVTWTASAGGDTPGFYVMQDMSTTSYTGDGTSGIFVWGADLRSANDTIYPYQRIEAATVYDSDTSKFPLYLACDGSDDSLYTAANLDLSSTDKLTVFAGHTKLSDATLGMLAELSATDSGNNGMFSVITEQGPGYSWRSKGTLRVDVAVATGYAAPTTRVLTGIGDISGDLVEMRLDGVSVSSSTGDQGTGNFGSYPLYIGRRNNASLPFNGRIYQLIVRGAASSAAEISSTERYIAGKQGRSL